jgi:hypothetical protein
LHSYTNQQLQGNRFELDKAYTDTHRNDKNCCYPFLTFMPSIMITGARVTIVSSAM